MKKILFAIMVVCTTVIANAAAIDWSATNVANPWGGDKVPASGWLGYVVLSSDLATVKSDLLNNKTESLQSKAVGPVKTTTSKGQFALDAASGNVAAGEQEFYLIVINAASLDAMTGFFVSEKATATVDASLDTSVNFGKQTGTATKEGWTSTSSATPEPTSGILFILGMAGLALKRKCA